MLQLLIAGMVPFSTVDMPGRNAAVLFCQGCPWRCRYCHNAHLRKAQADAPLAWAEILAWLEPRVGFLEAVVFSGGEPLLQAGLGAALGQVKAMGLQVGLHTGGYRPGSLGEVLPLLDWIGLDLKAPRHAYDRITGVPGSGQAAWASLALTLGSGIAHEIRTTGHPGLLAPADLAILARDLARAGVRNWALQTFRGQGCVDAALTAQAKATLDEGLVRQLEAIFLGEAAGPSSGWEHPVVAGPRRFSIR